MNTQPVLDVQNLTKIYPGVIALDNVHIQIKPGEVHALIGENGAGKSTLIKCITGAVAPTSGEISFCGQRLDRITPQSAIELGISAIYQEFNLVPYLSVAENIMIGRYPNRLHIVNDKKMRQAAQAIIEELGVPIDIDTAVQELSVGYQQLVEIAKAVSRDAKMLIMDEPSAALTNNELHYLFEIIKRLRKKGISILYISHRLEEIFEICDRVTVFRDGKYIDTVNIEQTDQQTLIRLMVNRELTNIYPHQVLPKGKMALEVKGLCTPMLRDISFSVREGEILGFSGLVGSGRTEIMRAIFGADRMDAGELTLYGKPYKPSTPRKAIMQGIGLITEDRKQQGLVLDLSIRENVVLANLKGIANSLGITNPAAIDRATQELCEKLQVKAPSSKQLVRNLSGGNQQKVVLAKWLFSHCAIIIFDEPTRGIDVGAKHEIYMLMDELVRQGKAIIMISSEMPEMLGMADRIIVMHEGKMMAELDAKEATQERILTLASGIKECEGATER